MNIVIIGNKDPFVLALQRTIFNLYDKFIFVGEYDFERIVERTQSVFLILDTRYDVPSQVIKWVWNKLRLNEERIGKKLAGLPILVLGMDKKFLELPEGKVFRDYKYFHQYLTKPLNLQNFLKTLSILSPIDPSSLPVVNQDAPKSLLGALEHDLKDISKKFNYNRDYKKLKKRFHDIIIDLSNYELLEKDEKKVLKAKEEVGKLENKIVKRMGNKWE